MPAVRPTLRRRTHGALRIAHLSLGLTAGLYFAVLGLTGSVLVFRDEIEARTLPVPSAPPASGRVPLSLEAILGRLHAAYPRAEPGSFTTVTLPKSQGGPYSVYLSYAGRMSSLSVDPFDGSASPPSGTGSLFLKRVEDLHVHLLWKERGEAVSGYASLAVIVLLVSGLTLWWPPKASQWKRRMSLRRAGGLRAWTLRLHGVVGFGSVAFTLLAATSGAALVFNDPVQRFVYRLTNTPSPPAPVHASLTASPLLVDALLAVARRAAPDSDPIFLTLPTHPRQPFYCLLETRPRGMSPYVSVYVDPGSGAELRVQRDDAAPVGRRIMGAVPPLHLGAWGGLPVKCLYAAFGFAPLVLLVTGVAVYASRWRRRTATEQTTTATK